MLLIHLNALWALLGAGLPLVTPVVDIATLEGPSDILSNATSSLDSPRHNATVSSRSNIAKRGQWPWDPPGVTDPRVLLDPERYQCHHFTGMHNKIPPLLMTGPSPLDEDNGQPLIGTWEHNGYTAQEVYTAFRLGAGALMDMQQLNAEGQRHRQVHYNGLGNWRPSGLIQNLPVTQRTTFIHEYPLVQGGQYPRRLDGTYNDYPGFDRVIFQIVRGVPLYLGVVQIRNDYPNYNGPRQDEYLDRWAFPCNEANGFADRQALNNLHYPGLDGVRVGMASRTHLRYRRENTVVTPLKPLPDYLEPTPSQAPGGDGGSGAPGGGSGSGVEGGSGAGLGGIGFSGGGASGYQGAWGVYGGPIPGNTFKKGGPGAFLSGPSHIEL